MEEGTKDRPCAVVLATKRERGKIIVVVAPITHTPPGTGSASIEIPAMTKQRLGLDDAQSWIIADDLNAFVWPGPDVRTIDQDRGLVYGLLPSGLTKALLLEVRRLRAQGREFVVKRT
jgi:hypothetical protein